MIIGLSNSLGYSRNIYAQKTPFCAGNNEDGGSNKTDPQREAPLNPHVVPPLSSYIPQKKHDPMEKLPVEHVHKLFRSRPGIPKPNIYRGETLYDAGDEAFKIIKKAGIKTVIDLDNKEDFKEQVENAGLNYYCFDIYGHIDNPQVPDTEKKDSVVDFIKEMQKDNIYICGNDGLPKVDEAVMINNLLNPNFQGGAWLSCYAPERSEHVEDLVKRLYPLMTEDDKISMGWTPKFEKRFQELMTD